MELYREQHKHGLHFLHEHPATASSWSEKSVMEVLHLGGVQRVVGDMCTFGMKHGEEYVRKPTAFMTNAPCIAEALNKRCTKDHRHVPCCGKVVK